MTQREPLACQAVTSGWTPASRSPQLLQIGNERAQLLTSEHGEVWHLRPWLVSPRTDAVALPGQHVALAVELWNLEGVNDVGRMQLEFHEQTPGRESVFTKRQVSCHVEHSNVRHQVYSSIQAEQLMNPRHQGCRQLYQVRQ